ncbi:MAG TPA: TonB family protein [Chitinophagaceae bacterium]|nr:TonB family protein [Chitinophagaceae bacterium]
MNATYLILFNLCLALWLGLYKLAFGRSTFFKMNRFVLLGGVLIAAVAAAVPPGWSSVLAPAAGVSGAAAPALISGGGITISGVTITAPFGTATAFPYRELILLLYWSGVVVMSLLLAWKLLRLYLVFRRHSHLVYPDHVHVVTGEGEPVYSFGRYLFGPGDLPKTIYGHEMIHIGLKHTADNMLLEAVKIFCWFNPFVYLYQRTLRTVHEYMADAISTRTVDKEAYAFLLVSHLFQVPESTLAHHFFNRSLIQKRLIMLQRNVSSRRGRWKYFLAVPLMMALALVSTTSFTLRDTVARAVNRLEIPAGEQPSTIQGVVTNQSGNPLARVSVMQVGTTRGTITDEKGHFTLDQFPANGLLRISMIGYTSVTVSIPGNKPLHVMLYRAPNRMKGVVVVGYAKDVPPAASVRPASSGKVFTFVEQMPHFPGGKAALMKYLHDNIRYPQTARADHLQGNVVVSFLVGKQGRISQVQTLNDKVGGGLETEAMRVVGSMPEWIPGRQNGEAVDVLYTLPIHFVLQ